MIIRQIQDDDVPLVIEMILRNWDEVLSKHHSAEIVRKFRSEVNSEWLLRQMEWKQIWVVEDAGSIVATGALADFGEQGSPKPCISQFFVLPDLHRQGIGMRLLEHILDLVRESGCKRVHVPSSLNAVSFYESVGFVVDEKQPNQVDEITWMSMEIDDFAEQWH